MTEDQNGQTRGVGHVVRGEAVPDDETEANQAEQTTPPTRFQKVASALRGSGPAQAAAVSSPDHGDATDDNDKADTALADEVGASQDPSVTRPGRGRQAGIVTEPLPVTGDGPAATRAGTGLDPALGDLGDFAYGSLMGDAAELRAQWHQIQYMFVDDPRGSVAEAADVTAQVSAKLEAAIGEWLRAVQDRQRSLRGRWGEGTNADTETLRETLRMYRNFLDQLTGSPGPTGSRGPAGS
jgi:hypothetical protein